MKDWLMRGFLRASISVINVLTDDQRQRDIWLGRWVRKTHWIWRERE